MKACRWRHIHHSCWLLAVTFALEASAVRRKYSLEERSVVNDRQILNGTQQTVEKAVLELAVGNEPADYAANGSSTESSPPNPALDYSTEVDPPLESSTTEVKRRPVHLSPRSAAVLLVVLLVAFIVCVRRERRELRIQFVDPSDSESDGYSKVNHPPSPQIESHSTYQSDPTEDMDSKAYLAWSKLPMLSEPAWVEKQERLAQKFKKFRLETQSAPVLTVSKWGCPCVPSKLYPSAREGLVDKFAPHVAQLTGTIKKYPRSSAATAVKGLFGEACEKRFFGVRWSQVPEMWGAASIAWWKSHTAYVLGEPPTQTIALRSIRSVGQQTVNGHNAVVITHEQNTGGVRDLVLIFEDKEGAGKYASALRLLMIAAAQQQ